jgi:hypothetical protein
MEKAYNYTETIPENETLKIKKSEPKIVLKSIFPINRESNKKIENLEVNICKKLFTGRSIFSLKGLKRFFRVSMNNDKIHEIKFGAMFAIGTLVAAFLLYFGISSIDFSTTGSTIESTREVGRVAESLNQTVTQMSKMFSVVLQMAGLLILFLGVFGLKKYADDPRYNSLMKPIVYIMAGSMMSGFPMLSAVASQGMQ